VYSPTQNRIYFVPALQSSETNWHYIDCDTGNVVEYSNNVTAVSQAYSSGTYSSTENRIYFVPFQQAPQSVWHYIQEYSDIPVSRNLMAGALFNKY